MHFKINFDVSIAPRYYSICLWLLGFGIPWNCAPKANTSLVPPHMGASIAASHPPGIQAQGFLQNCLTKSVLGYSGSLCAKVKPRSPLTPWPHLHLATKALQDMGSHSNYSKDWNSAWELCGWKWLLLREGNMTDGIRYYSNFTDKALSVSQKRFKINSSASQQRRV